MKSLQNTIKESLRIGICDEVKVPVYESLRIGICDEVKVPVCESLRIGINDKPESIPNDEFLDENCLCIVKQFVKNTDKALILFRDIHISEINPYRENSINYRISGKSTVFVDLEFDNEHFVEVGDGDILIRMIDNSVALSVYIIFNPKYNDQLIDLINSFSATKNGNELSIHEIFKLININININDIEVEIGRENFNEKCELRSSGTTLTNQIISALTHVSESLRIGINDQPEIDFDQDLSSCYILSFYRDFAFYKAVYRFEEYSVSSIKNEGNNIYTIFAETATHNSRGFNIKGITFKYDEDLNLFYLYPESNNSTQIKLYVLFFGNDERIEHMYPILANALVKRSSRRYAAKSILNVMLGVRDYDKLAMNIPYTYLSTNHTCDMDENEIENVIHNIKG